VRRPVFPGKRHLDWGHPLRYGSEAGLRKQLTEGWIAARGLGRPRVDGDVRAPNPVSFGVCGLSYGIGK